MRLEAAQYRELAAFAQFGSDLDEETRAKLRRGERLIEVFKQKQFQPLDVEVQVIVFFCLVNGYMDDVPVDRISEFENGLLEFMQDSGQEILDSIREKGSIDEEMEKKIEGLKTELAPKELPPPEPPKFDINITNQMPSGGKKKITQTGNGYEVTTEDE